MIVISEYRDVWPVWFGEVEACLLEELPADSGIVGVEHVGSTAVPGLAARPMLDTHVAISEDSALAGMVAHLTRLGYIHEGDRGPRGRNAFRRTGPDVPLRDPKRDWAPHHLYVSTRGGRELERHLALRDHLRSSDEDRDAYAALKRDLAAREGMTAEAYQAGKSSFIEAILNRERR